MMRQYRMIDATVAVAPEPTLVEEFAWQQGPGPNSVRTLLLEDEPLIAMGVEVDFESAGFAVTTVMSCEEANAWLDQHKPQIVIIDILLRDGPSDAVANRLVKSGIPFIVHSGDHRSLHERTPFAAASSWVGKPSPASDLLEAAQAAVFPVARLYPSDVSV